MIWIVAGATPLLIAIWLTIMVLAWENHATNHEKWRKEDRCTCDSPDISYWRYVGTRTFWWLCVLLAIAAVLGCITMIVHGMDQVWPSDD